jgi:hypothetical protein
MSIIELPFGFIRSTSWGLPPVYSLQRSAWTGRTRVIEIGPAARWTCVADIRPSRESDIPFWRAFQARMFSPGARVRLRRQPGSQFGPGSNLTAVPDARDWAVAGATAGITRFLATDAAPLPRIVQAVAPPTAGGYDDAARRAPATAGTVYYVAGSVRLTGSPGVVTPVRQVYLNSSLVFIAQTGASVAGVPAGVWTRIQGSGAAPAGTAFIVPSFFFTHTTGTIEATDHYIGLLPERCQVNGAGQTGMALNVFGLAPNLVHLRAGHCVTVVYPSGDEQLLALTADVVADGSGLAQLQFAAPMRQSPANNSFVELSRPWGLMRALEPLQTAHIPGGIVQPGAVTFEEAF